MKSNVVENPLYIELLADSQTLVHSLIHLLMNPPFVHFIIENLILGTKHLCKKKIKISLFVPLILGKRSVLDITFISFLKELNQSLIHVILAGCMLRPESPTILPT